MAEAQKNTTTATAAKKPVLLEVQDLKKHFPIQKGFLVTKVSRVTSRRWMG